MKMLNIKNTAEFRKNVLHKEEIRESDIGHGVTCFCYMVSAEGTFDSDWLRECRGITFDSVTGNVNGRPLTKFFNVNEKESTQVANLDWSKVVRVMDKRDGSMLTSVLTSDGVMLKTKKTFTSDVAIAANKWMNEHENVRTMVWKMAGQNCTAIFEWTSPDARIVINYPDAELRLLHVRNNETGEYMDGEVMAAYAKAHGVKCVEEVTEFWNVLGGEGLPLTREFDIKKMLEEAKTREGVEGWVIQFEDGDMVKLKTEWYMRLHRAMVFVRARDIAEAVVNESLDDTKAMMVGEGVDIQEILEIEAKVLSMIRNIVDEVELTVSLDSGMSQKDFAIKHTGHRYFGLMMRYFSKREPDYVGYFMKNLLKENFGLRQLVLVPSIAEGD